MVDKSPRVEKMTAWNENEGKVRKCACMRNAWLSFKNPQKHWV